MIVGFPWCFTGWKTVSYWDIYIYIWICNMGLDLWDISCMGYHMRDNSIHKQLKVGDTLW